MKLKYNVPSLPSNMLLMKLSYDWSFLTLQHQSLHLASSKSQQKNSWILISDSSSTRKKSSVRVRVPDTITSWVVDGISMSPSHGLALAEPVQLKTFKHFFVRFNTPYSAVRGEQIMIPLTIHNYLHHCAKVRQWRSITWISNSLSFDYFVLELPCISFHQLLSLWRSLSNTFLK